MHPTHRLVTSSRRALLPVAGLAGMVFLSQAVIAQTCVQTMQQEATRVCPTDDRDCDGIADTTETELLQRYRPYFLYASGEEYLPTRVSDYIRQSVLLTDGRQDRGDNIAATHDLMRSNINTPLLVYTAGPDFCWSGAAAGQKCSSDLRENPKLSRLHIDPLEHVPGNPRKDPGRHGVATWAEVLQSRNAGLYGHVSLIRLPIRDGRPHLPQTCSRDGDLTSEWWHNVPMNDGSIYYKVEYWQFFGYNEPHVGLGRIRVHEGDWTTVQLIVKAPPPTLFPPTQLGSGQRRRLWTKTTTDSDSFPGEIIAVMMFMHGLEIRYRMDQPFAQRPIVSGKVMELRGRNFGKASDLEWVNAKGPNQCQSDVPNLQDNMVRFFQDPGNARFTHPMVYPERGAHEFWPTQDEHWAYRGAPEHSGIGQRFLSGTVPNLGEFAHPLSETPEASVILHYNGRWGAHRMDNDPPQGPTLHGQWNFFPNEAVRTCLLQGGGGGY